MRTVDVVVVGGGVIGCACAFGLAREGLRVALLERDDLASQASGAAAGMLLPAGEAHGPGPFLHWGLRSLARFAELSEELRERSGIDPEYEPSGALYTARSDEEVGSLRSGIGRLPGLALEWLDARSARDAEPQLAEDVAGALWSPREGHVRSPLLARAYAAAAGTLGASVETGVEVTGLRVESGRVAGVAASSGDWAAGHVVLCAGSWTPACAGPALGAGFAPIEPVRGQIASLASPLPGLRSIVLAGSTYLVPKRDASVVVGATEEHVGFDCRVTTEGLCSLLDAASRLVPSLAGVTFHSAWAGLRPATPDRLPVVGPVPGVAGLIVASGHFRNGVLLSPVTAGLVADLVLGKALPPEADAFLPQRFAG